MRALASTPRARCFWITLVIFSLARLPVPIPVLSASGLIAHDAASPDDATSGPRGHAWEWRWVTLCPGASCPNAGNTGAVPTDRDADGDECEAEVEFLPAGRSRGIATPFAVRAFDATPIGTLVRVAGPSDPAASRGFAASFSPDIPRAALLQRWIC